MIPLQFHKPWQTPMSFFRRCVNCDLSSRQRLNRRFEAYYCETCGEWLQGACLDGECPACQWRPEKAV